MIWIFYVHDRLSHKLILEAFSVKDNLEEKIKNGSLAIEINRKLSQTAE